MNKEPIKFLIWVYFWLLIFEGALRRWVFREFADVLLLVKDPIALLIIVSSFSFLFREKYRNFVLLNFFIGILGCVFTMLVGHQDWIVTVYGARIHFLHYPLIFIIPQILTKDDFRKFGKTFLFLSLPMSILYIIQFINPLDHWINRDLGGHQAEWGGGALPFMGKGRPPGTFVMTAASAIFNSIVVCFYFSNISEKKKIPLWAWIVPFSIMISLAFSISRGLIAKFALIVIGTFVANAITKKTTKYLIFITFLVIPFLMGYYVLSNSELFKEAEYYTTQRYTGATSHETGSDSPFAIIYSGLERIKLYKILEFAGKYGPFGLGIGTFTNVARVRIADYAESRVLSESIFGYHVMEYGPYLGLIYIFWKLLLTWKLGRESFYSATKDNSPFGLIFFSYVFSTFNFTNLSSPNIMGLVIFVTALNFTAIEVNKKL